MNFFEEICRNLGLMFHNIKHPDQPAGILPTAHRQQISHIVEEQKISPTMTLRRTTIDEIEISKSSE